MSKHNQSQVHLLGHYISEGHYESLSHLCQCLQSFHLLIQQTLWPCKDSDFKSNKMYEHAGMQKSV